MSDNKKVNYKPIKWAWCIYCFVAKVLMKFKYNLKVDNKEFRKRDKSKGAVILFNHESNDDHFITTASAGFSSPITYVVTDRFYFDAFKRVMFKFVRAITRHQYIADMESTLKMKRAVKQGCVINLSATGQVNTCNNENFCPPQIVKLLKMFQVDIWGLTIKGAHIAYPKWTKKNRKTRVESELKLLVKGEDLKSLSDDELLNIVKNISYFNDETYQKEAKHVVKAKSLSDGLENALFVCPTCFGKYTIKSVNNTLTCSNCNTVTPINKYGLLSGKEGTVYSSEKAWWDFQRNYFMDKVKEDDFKIDEPVTLYRESLEKKKMIAVGHGILHLDKTSLYYDGTCLDNDNYHKDFIYNIPQTPSTPNLRFNIPDPEGIFEFTPDTLSHSLEIPICIDVLNELRIKNEL